MYKALLKKFYSKPTATHTEKEVNMKQAKLQPDLAAQELNVELAAQLAASSTAATLQAEAFEEITKKFAEMSALYEGAQVALAAAAVAQAALVTEAADKRLAARKEVVVMALGTAKADAFLMATNALDDASFEAIVGSMAMSFEVESKTEGFQEIGVAGKETLRTTLSDVPKESAEMTILKAKYRKK
jgi:hypothetical protein